MQTGTDGVHETKSNLYETVSRTFPKTTKTAKTYGV